VEFDKAITVPEKWLLGDMLWAKVSGHPWWPCIVAVDPTLDQHTRVYRRKFIF